MASTVQKNWGGVPAVLPGLSTIALTTHPEACALPSLCQQRAVRLWAEIPNLNHAIASLSRDTCRQPCSGPSYPGADPSPSQGLDQPSLLPSDGDPQF